MFRRLPATAIASILLSGVLLIVGAVGFGLLLYSSMNINFFRSHVSLYGLASLLLPLFLLLLLVNIGLVMWEFLIALRTKEHFWVQYLSLVSVVLFCVTASIILAKAVSSQDAPSCGCVVSCPITSNQCRLR